MTDTAAIPSWGQRRAAPLPGMLRNDGSGEVETGILQAHQLVLFAMLLLIGIGLIMIYSSSFVATERGSAQDGYFYLRRQLLWTMLGFAGFLAASSVPVEWWRRSAPWILGAVLLLLLLLLVPGMAAGGKGVRRWFRFAGMGIQPSELAKIALVLGVAWYLTLDADRPQRFVKGFVASVGLVGLVTAPILMQPDVGTAIFLAVVGLSLAFVAGVRLRYLLPSALISLPGALLIALALFPHVQDRINTFLRPSSDPSGKGHQVHQALIGLGAGGDFGIGLGLSRQKLFYLPERHTDFIFAVIGEELGLAGSLLVLALFITLLLALRRVAARATDSFSFLFVTGMMLLIGFQATMNVAVVTGAIPPKGISLPFVSYGGSGLLGMMIGLGIVTAIGTRRPTPALATGTLGVRIHRGSAGKEQQAS